MGGEAEVRREIRVDRVVLSGFYINIRAEYERVWAYFKCVLCGIGSTVEWIYSGQVKYSVLL